MLLLLQGYFFAVMTEQRTEVFHWTIPNKNERVYHAYSDDCDCAYCWSARGRK
jgi:hypothetical protein